MHLNLCLPGFIVVCLVFKTTCIYRYLHFLILGSPNLRSISNVYPCVDSEGIAGFSFSPTINMFLPTSNSFSSSRVSHWLSIKAEFPPQMPRGRNLPCLPHLKPLLWSRPSLVLPPEKKQTRVHFACCSWSQHHQSVALWCWIVSCVSSQSPQGHRRASRGPHPADDELPRGSKWQRKGCFG